MGIFSDVVDWFEEAAEDAGDWVEGAADDAAEAAEDVWDWATDIVDDVSEWTVNAFEDAWELVEEGAADVEDMIETLEHAIESMPEAAAAVYEDLVALLEAAAAEAAEVAEDVVDAVDDALGHVDEDVLGALEDALETAGDVLGAGVDAIGDAIDVAGDVLSDGVELGFGVLEDAWNGTIGPIVDDVLEALEEAGVFDAVDWATVGLVDISYDGSDFHLDVGLGGVYHAGFDIGADGISVEGSVWGMGSAAGGIGSDGALSIGLEVGVEGVSSWGGQAGVDGDGNVSIEGHGEVHIPDPSAGTIDLEIGAYAEEHDDGFGAGGSTTVGHTSATGQHVGVGVHGSHEQHGDDSVSTIGVHASAGQVGIGEATVSLDHTVVVEDGSSSNQTTVTASTDSIFGSTSETVVLQQSEEGDPDQPIVHATDDPPHDQGDEAMPDRTPHRPGRHALDVLEAEVPTTPIATGRRHRAAADDVPDPVDGGELDVPTRPAAGLDDDVVAPRGGAIADHFRPNPSGDGTIDHFFRPNPTGDGTTEQVVEPEVEAAMPMEEVSFSHAAPAEDDPVLEIEDDGADAVVTMHEVMVSNSVDLDGPDLRDEG